MRTTITLLALLAAAAAPTTALAAKPKLPSQFAGGNGRGTPMGFKLNKKGKVTSAFAGYTCKGRNGIGSATSNRPKGKIESNGKLTITYKSRGVSVKFKVTFPTKTTAKGTITFTSKSCKAPKVTFTAQRTKAG